LLFLLGLFTCRHEHHRRCRSMIVRSRTAPTDTTFVAPRSKSCRRLAAYTTGC
jgi:hypothetical protein